MSDDSSESDEVDAADPDEVDAVGWDAIDAALAPVYGDQEPKHFGVLLPYALGGPDPLQGISAYWNQSPPHWHFVTYGFSELYEKETDDDDVSGFGFELTLRLKVDERGEGPPLWATSLLQNLGRYVFSSGNCFGAGHHMNLNGPIALEEETQIEAIAFAHDPRLPKALETPNGKVDLLQIVGLTTDELEATRAWDTEKLLELMSEHDPLLLIDLGRASITEDPQIKARIEEGIARDGSSQGEAFVPSARWEPDGDAVRVIVGANAVANVAHLLRGRILHGRPFLLLGEEGAVAFKPLDEGQSPGTEIQETEPEDDEGETGSEESAEDVPGLLVVGLDATLAQAIATDLQPKRGDYTWPALPGVTLRVIPSNITDADGNPIETIG